MVKIGFEIKNGSKAFKPKKGDVIIFDGKSWYITTKEDLLEDSYRLIEECKAELENMKEFKKEVASEIKTLSDLIQVLYKNSEEN